jgi:uncharacterized protein (TIGR02996 family)
MNDERFNEDLERELAESPDDRATFTAYAAWLTAQGSPRGELAAVQLEREVGASKALEAREEELIAANAALFRGAHATRHSKWLDDFTTKLTWRGGFWRAVNFSGPRATLAALLAHPSARLLHSLAIAAIDDEEESFDGALEELVGARATLGALRTLRLGNIPEGQTALAGFGDRACTNRLEVANMDGPDDDDTDGAYEL